VRFRGGVFIPEEPVAVPGSRLTVA